MKTIIKKIIDFGDHAKFKEKDRKLTVRTEIDWCRIKTFFVGISLIVVFGLLAFNAPLLLIIILLIILICMSVQ